MKKLLLILLFVVEFSCDSSAHKNEGTADPITHEMWTQLLQKHVNSDGKVNYTGFTRDSTALNEYLGYLEKNPPNSEWSKEERMAYWINAYNAYTVKLIVKHYPLESIKAIGNLIQIPFINSPWDIKFIKIGNNKYDLNNIEHDILRKEFDDPRIHFAIVCASVSCPKLLNVAYEAKHLNNQLDYQAVEFINDPARNILTEDHIRISKIFSWFKGDFTKDGSLINFLNKYSKVDIDDNAKVDHIEYDWGLNE